MKTQEFINQIESNYSKYFNGLCKVKLSHNLYSDITVHCFLARDKTELSGGYYENDMLSIQFSITEVGKQLPKDLTLESELPSQLQMKIDQKSYYITPQEKYLAYSRVTLPFRKTKGTSEKLIKIIDNNFKKLHDSITENKNLIHKNFIEFVKNNLL